MAPLCSSNEGSTHRKCPGVDTRSVRRASGLLETGFSVSSRHHEIRPPHRRRDEQVGRPGAFGLYASASLTRR
jgi:hypothetical protein